MSDRIDPQAPDSQVPQSASLTDEQVAEYLRAHVDFFDLHPDVLARMALRHPQAGRAISLIERQIDVLREKHRVLERRIAELVRTAQDNNTIFDRLQAMVRAVLLARDDTALPAIVEAAVRDGFAVPQVALRLWRHDAAPSEPADPQWVVLAAMQPVEPAVIEQTATLTVPYCGAPDGWHAARLLSEGGADTRSIALVPLRVGAHPRPFGLLALGSADAGRFSAELGVAFLLRIGEVASAALARLVAPEPRPETGPEPRPAPEPTPEPP